jgi:hypothetical protein
VVLLSLLWTVGRLSCRMLKEDSLHPQQRVDDSAACAWHTGKEPVNHGRQLFGHPWGNVEG